MIDTAVYIARCYVFVVVSVTNVCALKERDGGGRHPLVIEWITYL